MNRFNRVVLRGQPCRRPHATPKGRLQQPPTLTVQVVPQYRGRRVCSMWAATPSWCSSFQNSSSRYCNQAPGCLVQLARVCGQGRRDPGGQVGGGGPSGGGLLAWRGHSPASSAALARVGRRCQRLLQAPMYLALGRDSTGAAHHCTCRAAAAAALPALSARLEDLWNVFDSLNSWRTYRRRGSPGAEYGCRVCAGGPPAELGASVIDLWRSLSSLHAACSRPRTSLLRSWAPPGLKWPGSCSCPSPPSLRSPVGYVNSTREAGRYGCRRGQPADAATDRRNHSCCGVQQRIHSSSWRGWAASEAGVL
jgi:hypothetical protein